MNYSAVRAVIFDLGGVLLDLDFAATFDAFRQMGIEQPQTFFSKDGMSDLFERFEDGSLRPTDFMAELRAATGLTFGESDFTTAWCAMLGRIPVEKYAYLEALHKRYPLFVLSNTNCIHQVHFERTVNADYGWQRFASLFQEVHYSHELGLRKPHKETFIEVLRRARLRAEEVLFIDDTEQHIIGARGAGLHTLHAATNAPFGESLMGLLT
jgi:putative hydrolase of the HAD superfamily